MAPPGVYSFYHHLDTMTLGSVFSLSPSSSLPKSSTSSSSGPSKLPSPGVSAILSDHDYVLKPVPAFRQPSMTAGEDSSPEWASDSGENSNSSGDAMLSSSALDFENLTDDTDFLQELDDLHFNMDDLDPCSDVTVENSFQEFIDSALDKSFISCPIEDSAPEKTAVIFNKEDFLRTLDLAPVQNVQQVDSYGVSSLADVNGESDNNVSTLSLQIGLAPMLSPTASLSPSSILSPGSLLSPTLKDLSTFEIVPTKRCSCSGYDCTSSAVYTTAHSPQQESVRTCPSTPRLSIDGEDSMCKNCYPTRLNEGELLPPLSIDTRSYGFSDTLQPLSGGCLDILMEDDAEMDEDKDTKEFLEWLHEDQSQPSDSNNNVIFIDSSSSSNSVDQVAADSVETSRYSSVLSTPLDLEAFVELEEDIASISEDSEHSNIYIQTHSSHQQTQQHPKQESVLAIEDTMDTCISSTSVSDEVTQSPIPSPTLSSHKLSDNFSCTSQLRLSILDEFADHFWDAGKFRNDTDSCMSLKGSRDICGENQASPHVAADICSPFGGAKTWSGADPVQHSPLLSLPLVPVSSPQTLGGDNVEMLAEKSHLALLHLFSDDNAPSLLHTDSANPNIRFM